MGTCAHHRVHENLNISGCPRPAILHPLQPTNPLEVSVGGCDPPTVSDKSKTMLEKKIFLSYKMIKQKYSMIKCNFLTCIHYVQMKCNIYMQEDARLY
jgi:hypothetical protein